MEQRVCQVPNDLVIPFSISMKISQKINKSFFLQSPHSLLLKSLSFWSKSSVFIEHHSSSGWELHIHSTGVAYL